MGKRGGAHAPASQGRHDEAHQKLAATLIARSEELMPILDPIHLSSRSEHIVRGLLAPTADGE